MAKRTLPSPVSTDHKRPCPECGLLRDPHYAEDHPCACCGTLGVVRRRVTPKDETDESAVANYLAGLFNEE